MLLFLQMMLSLSGWRFTVSKLGMSGVASRRRYSQHQASAALQGVEAQTLANVYIALENDLEIIPVINKIDLPGVRGSQVAQTTT